MPIQTNPLGPTSHGSRRPTTESQESHADAELLTAAS
jgi:hypothetical protein